MTSSDELGERVCLVSACVRRAVSGVCWWHRLVPALRDPNPLESPVGEFADWWGSSRARRQKLERATSPRVEKSQNVRLAARRELGAIGREAVELLVPLYLERWRAATGMPAWRLPSDGWLLAEIGSDVPDLDLSESLLKSCLPSGPSSHVGPSRALDLLARHYQEHVSPTPAPFRPITEPRRPDPDRIKALEGQEEANEPRVEYHADALHGFKQLGTSADLAEVFADPGISTSVPESTVVYHQIRDTTGRKGFRSSYSAHSFQAHMQLVEGDIVSYQHIRSSTTKTTWFTSLDPYAPAWLNQGGAENALRLELVPLEGLYISERSSRSIGTPLGAEDELILPAGTYWRVLGVRDTILTDEDRPRSPYGQRIRGVQMVQIDPESTMAAAAKTLTIPATHTSML